MKLSSFTWRRGGACFLLLTAVLNLTRAEAAPITLYSTQFEPAQGFVLNNPIPGRDGWVSDGGSGGNGIRTNDITGFGQSAYIGKLPAVGTNGLYLWRPLNFTPTNRPLVEFTVDFTMFDSTTTNRDEFRWSVYNLAGQRLFSLILDNRDLGIYYQLDDGEYYDSGWSFNNEDVFTLQIRMNFAANRWDAWVGESQVVPDEPITTTNAARTLGDVDVVWLRGTPNQAGDNFMVFDNYTITADVLPAPPLGQPAALQLLGAINGQYLIRIDGSANAAYAVEASTNLVDWTALRTNVATDGYFYHLDSGSVGLKQRYYRARWVP